MLLSVLTRDAIIQLADNRSYQRGVIYYHEGRVGKITEQRGSISAAVEGTHKYRVKLWAEGKELAFSCTCPIGDEGEFCKHCVAVGLKWLAHPSSPAENKSESKKSASVSLDDVKRYLSGLSTEKLVEIIMEQVNENDRLHQQLILKTAKQYSKSVDMRAFRALIDDAFIVDGFIDYSSIYDYSTAVDEVIDSIENLLKEGFANEVIELSEYALSVLDEAIGSIDDSDGFLSMAMERLHEIHLKACKKARPDPEALARRLFVFELNSQLEIFFGAVERYAKILGKSGIAVYRDLANKAWAEVTPLKPGEKKEFGKRFRITSIMEGLARQSGNIEELVAIKSRDLSHAYSFLQIADIYKKAGMREKALEWAEKGVRAFPERTDSRLREFLAQEYHHYKRNDEEMNLIWANFCEALSLESYKELKKHADRIQSWNDWRESDFGRSGL